MYICPSFRRLAIELGPEDNLLEEEEEEGGGSSSQLDSPPIVGGSETMSQWDVPLSVQKENTLSPPPLVKDSSSPGLAKKSISSAWALGASVDQDQDIDSEDVCVSSPGPTQPSDSPAPHQPTPYSPPSSCTENSPDSQLMFSPQEVKRRSSSLRRVSISKAISVVDRVMSSDDIVLEEHKLPRSPEFTFTSRNRSNSERKGLNDRHALRRMSSGPRIEGAVQAALEFSKLDSMREIKGSALDKTDKNGSGSPGRPRRTPRSSISMGHVAR
jgi:hypothetical protein